MLYDRGAYSFPPSRGGGVEHRISFADGTRQAAKGAYYCGHSGSGGAGVAAALSADATGVTLPACAFGPASPPMAVYSQPYSALYGLTRDVETYDPHIYPAPPARGPLPAWDRGGGPVEGAPLAGMQMLNGPFLTGTYQPPAPPAASSSVGSLRVSDGKGGETQQTSRAAGLGQRVCEGAPGGPHLWGPSQSISERSASTVTPSPSHEPQRDAVEAPCGSAAAAALIPLQRRESAEGPMSWGPLDAEKGTSYWGPREGRFGLHGRKGDSVEILRGERADSSIDTIELFVDSINRDRKQKQQEQEQQQQQQQEQQQHQHQQRPTPLPSFTRTEELLAHSQTFGGARPAALIPKNEQEDPGNSLGIAEPKDLEGWRNLATELSQAKKVMEAKLQEQTKRLSELQQALDKEVARAAADKRLHQQTEAELQTAREELQRYKHAAKIQQNADTARRPQPQSPHEPGHLSDADLRELFEEVLRNYVDAQKRNELLRNELEQLREGKADAAQAQFSKEIRKLQQDVYMKDAVIGRWEQFASTIDSILATEGASHALFIGRVRREVAKVMNGGIKDYVPCTAQSSHHQQHPDGMKNGGSSRSPSISSRSRNSSSSSKMPAERHSTDTDGASVASASAGTGLQPKEAPASIAGSSKTTPISATEGHKAAVLAASTKSVRQRIQEYNANNPSDGSRRSDNRGK